MANDAHARRREEEGKGEERDVAPRAPRGGTDATTEAPRAAPARGGGKRETWTNGKETTRDASVMCSNPDGRGACARIAGSHPRPRRPDSGGEKTGARPLAPSPRRRRYGGRFDNTSLHYVT